MPWHVPQTFTASQLVDATDLNEDVRDNMNYLKNKMMAIPLFADNAGALFSNPNTTYNAMAGTVLPKAKTKVDFSQLENSLTARVVVTASGNTAGASRGIAIYETTGGTLICEVLWTATGTIQYALAGSWTGISLSADTVLEIRIKGASAIDDLTIYRVEVQIRG